MDPRINHVVLIVAHDPVLGALLGLLMELVDYAPQFPSVNELPRDAIERVRASLVVLDCDHDAACEDLAYEAAERVGSEVLLFGHQRHHDRIHDMARERDVHPLTLPVEASTLVQLIDEALAA